MKKVVVIGPESTGKSTLCAELARHYGTFWCPEYAREYLLLHGTKYTYDDLLTIAKGQIDLEDNCIALAEEKLPRNDVLFIDTDMYVMKVWCEFVYHRCHPFILEQIATRKYDLYLLCNVDLPWAADELREYPDLQTRRRLYEIYESMIKNQPRPWVAISGDKQERLLKAREAVDLLLTA